MSWCLYDKRTGKKMGMTVYFTEQQALRAIIDLWKNDRRGRRKDLSPYLPHIDVHEMTPEQHGAGAGDLVVQP